MTRRSMLLHLLLVAFEVGVLTLVAIWVYATLPNCRELLKMIVPIGMLLPAAHLAFSYQRRTAFLSDLRRIYPDIVKAVHQSIQLTKNTGASTTEKSKVVADLAVAIDLVRCAFTNAKEDHSTDKQGLFPFEPLHGIYRITTRYVSGDIHASNLDAARALMWSLWKKARNALVQEFDRGEPHVSVLWATSEADQLRTTIQSLCTKPPE